MKFRRHEGFFSLALALLPLLALPSCGGGGGLAGGGTGGTGVGPVTGFGSVIVNGIRFDDAGIPAGLALDDAGRKKADLMTGMVVAVTGTINGESGRADNIAVLRHVDGPMDDNGADLANGILKVMGQDIVADAATVFDNVASLPALRTLQGANVNHPEIEVHGAADNDGVIHATFIHRWADNRVPGRTVQVRGTVSGLNTVLGTFFIGRKTVDFGGVPGGLPAGVAAGSFVEVKGTLRALDNVLAATSVRLEDATGGQPSGALAEVEGYVDNVLTDVLTSGSFRLKGANGTQTVTWTGATTAFQGGTKNDILAGVKVEVEGVRKADRSLAAAKIEFRRANNIRMEQAVTSVTAASLTVFGKTVKVDSLTQYKDSRDNLNTFGQLNIAVTDSLKVSAFLDNTTVPPAIVATRVERVAALAANNRILQGPVDPFLPGGLNPAGPDVAILGVPVSGATAVFLNADESVMTQAQFFLLLNNNQAAGKTTIVKARGTGVNALTAEEMQIEPTVGN